MSRWHPWRALREREHLRFELDDIADDAGGAFLGIHGDQGAVVISPSLGRRERAAALGHELVHDERRILSPDATDATMEREEVSVRDEVARRLVPLDELEAFAMRRGEVGPLLAWEVADEFDVPEHVAWAAVRLLQAQLLDAELRRSAASRAHRASDPRSPPIGRRQPSAEPDGEVA